MLAAAWLITGWFCHASNDAKRLATATKSPRLVAIGLEIRHPSDTKQQQERLQHTIADEDRAVIDRALRIADCRPIVQGLPGNVDDSDLADSLSERLKKGPDSLLGIW
jgi:hypothetical protein